VNVGGGVEVSFFSFAGGPFTLGVLSSLPFSTVWVLHVNRLVQLPFLFKIRFVTLLLVQSNRQKLKASSLTPEKWAKYQGLSNLPANPLAGLFCLAFLHYWWSSGLELIYPPRAGFVLLRSLPAGVFWPSLPTGGVANGSTRQYSRISLFMVPFRMV